MKSKMGKKWVKNSFFELFVENRPHLKFNFTYPELFIFLILLMFLSEIDRFEFQWGAKK